MPLPAVVSETVAEAVDQAKQPVRVRWRPATDGFLLGFLAALLPSALVAWLLPGGWLVTTLFLATALALAAAVANTAWEQRT